MAPLSDTPRPLRTTTTRRSCGSAATTASTVAPIAATSMNAPPGPTPTGTSRAGARFDHVASDEPPGHRVEQTGHDRTGGGTAMLASGRDELVTRAFTFAEPGDTLQTLADRAAPRPPRRSRPAARLEPPPDVAGRHDGCARRAAAHRRHLHGAGRRSMSDERSRRRDRDGRPRPRRPGRARRRRCATPTAPPSTISLDEEALATLLTTGAVASLDDLPGRRWTDLATTP